MKQKNNFYYDILDNITEKEKIFRINVQEEIIGLASGEDDSDEIEYQSVALSEEVIYINARSSRVSKKISALHSHNVPEILYIKEAEGHFQAEDKRYKLKKGDLIIIPSTMQHRISINSDTVYDRIDILFDPKFFHELKMGSVLEETTVINISENKMMREIFEKADNYFDILEENEFVYVLGILLKELMFNVGLCRGQSIKPKLLNPILSDAVEYIEKNLFEIKNVSEISDALFISESYLFELFRSKLKTTPIKYIKVKRMHAIRQEIVNGARPTEIFHKAGYMDYTAFYRNYVSLFGYSPSVEKRIKQKN